MLSGLTDEKLMRRYLDGDVRAFQELLDRHGKKVYNFILRNVGNRDLAEDLLQDVFMRVVKRASTFKEQSKFTTWLYTIARNLCIDHRRKARYRNHAELDKPLSRGEEEGATLLDRMADKGPSTADKVRDRRFTVALEEALGTLPLEQREVFEMREFQGLKFKEIAEVVGIPENTVKSRMRYALKALQTQLQDFAKAI